MLNIEDKILNIDSLLNWLNNQKITFLAGAGISFDSGIPIVSEFYIQFLSKFYSNKDAKILNEEIKKNRIPFERMIEHIFSYTNNDYSLLNIFLKGNPNINHMVLAKC